MAKSKYTPKTANQIKAEIKALKKIKLKVRIISGFGENNLDKIDAEIAVLEEDLNEDQIYDKWGPEKDEDGNDLGEPGPTLDSALHARRWMDGEEREGLAEGWKPAAGLK